MNSEGFWYSKYEPQYPKPIPNVLTQEEADNIFSLIKKKERRAGLTRYRGWSTSRIDNKTHVGSGTYKSGNWQWPEGFAEHYVRDHRVKPSDEFLQFIGYHK